MDIVVAYPRFTDEKAKMKSTSVHPPALDPWLQAWAPKQESELLQRAAGPEHSHGQKVKTYMKSPKRLQLYYSFLHHHGTQQRHLQWGILLNRW